MDKKTNKKTRINKKVSSSNYLMDIMNESPRSSKKQIYIALPLTCSCSFHGYKL